MENSYIMDKQSKYRELLSQIETFANVEDKAISVLSNCAAVMKMVFPKEYYSMFVVVKIRGRCTYLFRMHSSR